MAPEFAALLVFLGGGAFVAVILSLVSKQNERAHCNIAQLARRLGLELAPARKRFGFWPEPRATGRCRGKHAELYAYTTGSGKSRVRWVALAVTPSASEGLTFRLTRQGIGSKLSELFGAREIMVGDRTFDQAWFIQTNQPEFLRAALLPELRTRLTAAMDASGRASRASIKLENNAVMYAEAGDFSNERLCDRIARIADVLCDFADVAEVFAQSRRAG